MFVCYCSPLDFRPLTPVTGHWLVLLTHDSRKFYTTSLPAALTVSRHVRYRMPLRHETRHPYSPIVLQYSIHGMPCLALQDSVFPCRLPCCSIRLPFHLRFGAKWFSQIRPFPCRYWTTIRESYARKSEDEDESPHLLLPYA